MGFVTASITTSGPCACCGVGGVVLACRTRGGTASLVGCAEIVSPSTPPKKYRRGEQTGATTLHGWVTPNCPGAFDTTTNCVYTKWIQWDPVTGVLTSGGNTNCNGSIDATAMACPTVAILPSNCASTWSFTPTTAQRSTTGVCCQPAGNWLVDASDTLAVNLSDEDLDSDAIARLLAGAGGTWGAWTTVGDGTGGTCLASSCCQANWQQRVSGFSIGYQESQFRADMSALTPLADYVLEVLVYRRFYGSSDPWALLLTSSYGFTADGAGNAQVIDDVPNLEGYETFVTSPIIYPA